MAKIEIIYIQFNIIDIKKKKQQINTFSKKHSISFSALEMASTRRSGYALDKTPRNLLLLCALSTNIFTFPKFTQL